MIRYALVCDKQHEFESWFPNSAGYDKQVKRGLVTCPACGSAKIEKAIMAPRLARTDTDASAMHARDTHARDADESSGDEAAGETASTTAAEEKTPVAMLSPHEQEIRTKLKEIRDHLTRNSDNVGQRFPEEARKMHYGDVEHRSIYGEASPEEAKALADEGIPFHPLPILPDERN